MYLNKTCTNTSLKMNRDRSFRLSSTTHQRRPLQLNPGTLHGSMILFYWGFILFNLNSWHLLVKFPDFHVAASLKSERFPACIPAVPIGRTSFPKLQAPLYLLSRTRYKYIQATMVCLLEHVFLHLSYRCPKLVTTSNHCQNLPSYTEITVHLDNTAHFTFLPKFWQRRRLRPICKSCRLSELIERSCD